MINTNKSSSAEQQYAGHIIFLEVEKLLNVKLVENPKIYLADNRYTYIEPDFYSEENCIVGEIFAHIGKPKKAQDNKIANDILKMLLLDRVTGKKYRKIIVVCDEAQENKLKGLSALAESIRQFGIEIIKVDISDDLKKQITDAQERQKMINA